MCLQDAEERQVAGEQARSKHVVLHSFTHLGGQNAEPEFAGGIHRRVWRTVRVTGYAVWVTPFGYFNEWRLSVYGESLGKVWKE